VARYRRRYRSWRSRRYGRSVSPPSKYFRLKTLFGNGVDKIRDSFFELDDEALDELFSDYGAMHGDAAERYARATFPKWRARTTGLSGSTLERLVELVPPYLSPQQRLAIVEDVVSRHKRLAWGSQTIRISTETPDQQFQELDAAILASENEGPLANVPESVMQAASWLYDDDVTAARGVLAEIQRREHQLLREQARKDIELLKRTITSKQIKAANYTVQLPTKRLHVVAYTPSKCFVAQACCGVDALEVRVLQAWRDEVLLKTGCGRRVVVAYYTHGECLANIVACSPVLRWCARLIICVAARAIGLGVPERERL
jgi:hypothetical protein